MEPDLLFADADLVDMSDAAEPVEIESSPPAGASEATQDSGATRIVNLDLAALKRADNAHPTAPLRDDDQGHAETVVGMKSLAVMRQELEQAAAQKAAHGAPDAAAALPGAFEDEAPARGQAAGRGDFESNEAFGEPEGATRQIDLKAILAGDGTQTATSAAAPSEAPLMSLSRRDTGVLVIDERSTEVAGTVTPRSVGARVLRGAVSVALALVLTLGFSLSAVAFFDGGHVSKRLWQLDRDYIHGLLRPRHRARLGQVEVSSLRATLYPALIGPSRLVVFGTANNKGTEPEESLDVEVAVVDGAAQEVAHARMPLGVALSWEEIATLRDSAALEAATQAKLADKPDLARLAPGASIPFALVLLEPPAGATTGELSYALRIERHAAPAASEAAPAPTDPQSTDAAGLAKGKRAMKGKGKAKGKAKAADGAQGRN